MIINIVQSIIKVVTAYKNELSDKEQMHDMVMSDHFKTLREPIIEQQKKTDEKQDKVIEQFQKNQKATTSGLEDLCHVATITGDANTIK